MAINANSLGKLIFISTNSSFKDTIEGEIGMHSRQVRNKIRENVGNHQINPSTFDKTMEYLKKEKEKNNG